MCRLILARGRFDARAIINAAVAMSEGRTADHEGPTRCHPNGWGAVWKQVGAPHGLALHRDTRPISTGVVESSPVWSVETDFLAVHVRHATLARNAGLEFTHPLEREGSSGPWYFMHNGFLPTVHRLLGREQSHFDSREYFEYVVDAEREVLEPRATLEKLRAIPPGGSSGNAIAVNPRHAYLIHWTPSSTAYPRYFNMHRLAGPDFFIFASEVIPALGPAERWERVPAEQVFEIPLT
jgi:predicted glutamine amidotransferase